MTGFQNMDKLQAKLNKFKSNSSPMIMDALESAANTVRNAAIKSIAAEAGGLPYTRSNPKRSGIASAPGDAPHTDTGNLVNNIQVQRFDKSVDVGIMGDKAPYGKYLEFGTSKLAARPWLRPAYESSKSIIIDKLRASGAQITATLIKG